MLQVGENEIFELLNWRSFLVIKVGRLSTKCALHHEPGTQMVKDLGDETQKCLRVNHIVNQEGYNFLGLSVSW